MKTTMIKSSMLLAGLTLIGFLSCSNDKTAQADSKTTDMIQGDTTTTASGLKIVFTKKGDGKQAVAGNVVKVHYVGKLTNGTEFDNSVKRGDPIEFPLGQGRVIKGWDEGIAMMKVGDKATLVIPPNLGYGAQDMGTIPPNSTLIFDVELVDVREIPKPVPFNVEGKEIKKTPSGLQYVVVEESKDGEQAYANMIAEVDYTLYLADGTIIDSSIPGGKPMPFTIGSGGVIKGFDEGVRLMSVGDKYRLIIPPNLGYGAQGAGGVVPPNATLIFDIELKSLKRP
ncbi:MAG: FKBP-type peptidyl-prolyl cis-trans isomerase [Bacteroidia bacterium]